MDKGKKIFELAKDISLRREYFGGLAFIPITGEIIQLNRSAYRLLKRIKELKILETTQEDLAFWYELKKRGIVKEVSRDG